MNKNFIISIAIIIITIIGSLTTSCTYYPHLTGIPLIKEKGDTRIEGGVTILDPSIHASVSYGATEELALQAVFSANSVEYYGQGAIGFYKNIQDRNVMELYVGFGYGYSTYTYFNKTAYPLSVS